MLVLKQLSEGTSTDLIQHKRQTVSRFTFVMQMLSDTLFVGKSAFIVDIGCVRNQ